MPPDLSKIGPLAPGLKVPKSTQTIFTIAAAHKRKLNGVFKLRIGLNQVKTLHSKRKLDLTTGPLILL